MACISHAPAGACLIISSCDHDLTSCRPSAGDRGCVSLDFQRINKGSRGGSGRRTVEIFGFAGLHVLTNRTTVDETADRYTISMDLDTRGLASVFVDLTSHSEVHGRLGRDASYPDAYRADVRRNGADRHYGLDIVATAP